MRLSFVGFRFEHFDTERPILMQFTGLHDRNGCEICEGDILSRKSLLTEQTHFAKVVWDEGNARFMVRGKTFSELVSTALERGYILAGNVYENQTGIPQFIPRLLPL